MKVYTMKAPYLKCKLMRQLKGSYFEGQYFKSCKTYHLKYVREDKLVNILMYTFEWSVEIVGARRGDRIFFEYHEILCYGIFLKITMLEKNNNS